MWGNNWDLWQRQKAGNGSRKPDRWQNTALNHWKPTQTQLNKEEREQMIVDEFVFKHHDKKGIF